MPGQCWIGTSGWVYKDWRGVFYPEGWPSSKWLEFYASQFNTVELNNTFYHLPAEKTFLQWEKRVPEGFTFAVKASRFITHMKKLKEVEEPLHIFLSRARRLKAKRGPVLFQLPPQWRCDLQRLEAFLQGLPNDLNAIFEFREPSWLCEELYAVLRKFNAGFCIFDMPGWQTPLIVTSKSAYIRFHGSRVLYGSRYSKEELREWAQKIRELLQDHLEVYVYFNNDAYGYAVINARELREMV